MKAQALYITDAETLYQDREEFEFLKQALHTLGFEEVYAADYESGYEGLFEAPNRIAIALVDVRRVAGGGNVTALPYAVGFFNQKSVPVLALTRDGQHREYAHREGDIFKAGVEHVAVYSAGAYKIAAHARMLAENAFPQHFQPVTGPGFDDGPG